MILYREITCKLDNIHQRRANLLTAFGEDIGFLIGYLYIVKSE